jgi:glutamate-1-semialdehyde 2,1-aminomutase
VPHGTYTLRDMSARTLRLLEQRTDIACVLVNQLQALHPNASAPGDATLLASDRRAGADLDGYGRWLAELRRVCTARGIALIFDEVFVGFRLARGGAQEYFGVKADLVTYGKTVGGGLPIGVLCGQHRWMRRFRPDRPSEFCFARGTFNGHPYVMAAMDEFLRRIDTPDMADAYRRADTRWRERAESVNRRLEAEGLPVRVAHLSSIWTLFYTVPSRYNWMLQFYLKAEGLRLSWVGTGRLIFSHDYTDANFEAVVSRLVAGCHAMRRDGWWSGPAALTNRAIKRQVLREIVQAWMHQAGSRRPRETIGS